MKKNRAQNRQRVMIWILSLIVVLSMLCGYLISIASPKEPSTAAPTVTVAPVTP